MKLDELDRRKFLKAGVLAAVATAATGVMGAEAPGSAKDTAGNHPTTPALTPEGELIHVESHKRLSPYPAPPVSDPVVRKGVPGRKWVMVIDLAECDGCKWCTKICQKMHYTPSDREWIRVFQMQESEDTAPYWFPKPCFHCDKPPCTKVCPVDATFKRQDGIVLIDNERCIGCRFCMAACPYSTRFFNWQRPSTPPEAAKQAYSPEHGYPRRLGTVEKCDFCPEMAEAGQLPACAATCHMSAIYYGDANEDAVTNSKGETVRLSQFIRDRAGYRYLEELGTEPRVYYLPPRNRHYPAPGEDEVNKES
jgi:Fe-S-cluster-containing dehydrogenase component